MCIASCSRGAHGRDAVAEAISLASNLLVLRDPGRTSDEEGKPKGSVHGASVGVHASDAAIRQNDQARACALVHRYGSLGHPARPVFDVLLAYAVSEDGALHAEKYYRTVYEEFAIGRPAFRWRHLAALARVTASEHGFPTPRVRGSAPAREGVEPGIAAGRTIRTREKRLHLRRVRTRSRIVRRVHAGGRSAKHTHASGDGRVPRRQGRRRLPVA
jgi:hypothetical protein